MGVEFLKKGKDAKQAMAREQKKAEEREKNKVFRFYLPTGKESKITFLDGNLDAEGLLDINLYHEHQLYLNDSWKNWFICTGDNEPCPICEQGDHASLVGALTVIDHSEYVSPGNGKTYKDQVKLFIAKRSTIQKLQKYATKREGLAGCTFDVARLGDKAASVGDMFEFVEKRSLAILKKLYTGATALNYGEVLHYYTAEDLIGFGFGSKPVGTEGKKAASPAKVTAPEDESYEDKL